MAFLEKLFGSRSKVSRDRTDDKLFYGDNIILAFTVELANILLALKLEK